MPGILGSVSRLAGQAQEAIQPGLQFARKQTYDRLSEAQQQRVSAIAQKPAAIATAGVVGGLGLAALGNTVMGNDNPDSAQQPPMTTMLPPGNTPPGGMTQAPLMGGNQNSVQNAATYNINAINADQAAKQEQRLRDQASMNAFQANQLAQYRQQQQQSGGW